MGRANRTDGLPLNPTLHDLFVEALRELELRLDTHKTATVVSYNPATQRANVTVDQLQVVKDLAKNPTRAEPNPKLTLDPETLNDVPVAWPRTGAGYLTFPLNPGDKGVLHVQDRSLDAYLVAGQTAEPATRWTHDAADSVFVPGIFHSADPILPATSVTGTVIEGELVKLGRLALSPAMKGTLWAAYVTTVEGAFVTWTAAQPDPTPAANTAFIGTLGAANKVLFTALSVPATNWLSTKVQVE